MASILAPTVGKLASFALAGLAVGAFFVWADLQRAKESRRVYRDGYEAGQTAHALADVKAAEGQRETLEAAKAKREAEQREALAALQSRTEAAEARTRAALAKLNGDAFHAACDARPWPDDLRLVFPPDRVRAQP